MNYAVCTFNNHVYLKAGYTIAFVSLASPCRNGSSNSGDAQCSFNLPMMIQANKLKT